MKIAEQMFTFNERICCFSVASFIFLLASNFESIKEIISARPVGVGQEHLSAMLVSM